MTDVPGVRARPLRPQPGTYTPEVIEDIQVKAELGRYRIRGFGTLRQRPLPSPSTTSRSCPARLTRIPLEGYRERCATHDRARHAASRSSRSSSTSRS